MSEHDAPPVFDAASFLARAPREPGVYIMRGHEGEVLYIGKSKNLRARLRSYFSKSDTRPFVRRLPGLLSEIEVLLTRNEKEALLLESTMIKRHQPRFNVMLRDDKAYLQLRINPKHAWPRVDVVRRRRRDDALYFGPYHSSGALRETLRVLNRHFMLRTCTDRVLANRARPCLQYQIKRCPAPCVLEVDREAYMQHVEQAALFLRGRRVELIEQLRDQMGEAAETLAFETAARLRDQIQSIEAVLERQQVVLDEPIDQDVLAIERSDELITLQLLIVREGRLAGGEAFHFDEGMGEDAELLEQFLVQYYEGASFIPDEVIVPVAVDELGGLVEWLAERKGRKVRVHRPQRGKRRALLDTAARNAAHQHQEHLGGRARAEALLETLQRELALERLPRRMECFDISNLQGGAIVGSMVVFVDANPAKQFYRTYKVRHETQDDFASMFEVISRRYRRVAEGEEEAPDLAVIDGGKGQLGAALAALEELGLDGSFDLISLAKSRTVAGAARGPVISSPERVFKPGEQDARVLVQHSPALQLLARLRDEAHRTAVGYHRKVRSRDSLRSRLDDVPGVGPKRRRELLQRFGSPRGIREAGVEAVASVPGISAAMAQRILDHLKSA